MGDEATLGIIEGKIKESILRELRNGPQLQSTELPEQLLHRLDALEGALREQHNAFLTFLNARSFCASTLENSSGNIVSPPLPPGTSKNASPPPSAPQVHTAPRKATADASTQTPLARAPENLPSKSPPPVATGENLRRHGPSNLSRLSSTEPSPKSTTTRSPAFEDVKSPTLLETMAARTKADPQDQATLRQRKVAFAATATESLTKRRQATLAMDAARREIQRAVARKAAEARHEQEERGGMLRWAQAIALVVAGVMMLVMGLIVGLMAVATRHHNSLASM